ncbi:MAG: cytochrome d ubiquinol oxidase subunit II [Deltaproteobacteria bacterium]|nr:cytochrome d ubiquinol oxidase subunit II [Deltaproteobacteria bacterium]
MPPLPDLVAGSILVSLIIYALLGGADFGSGVWDLLSRGPRAALQRLLIAHAIGPVWESNHIWLIIAVVVLFSGFPQAFAVLSTALFVPVTLMLAGIVMRGAAFAFHSYRLHDEGGRSRWGTIFAAASLLTPVLLGTIAGAISSGKIRAQEAIAVGASLTWLAPFPLSVGLLTLAVFSHLAAVYLIFETTDPDLREDFRLRALWASVAVAALLILTPILAHAGASDFYGALLGSGWSVGLVFLTASAALGAQVALLLRAFPLARICAAAQAASILAGWGLAQYPFLVRPDLTVVSTASPPATLRLILYSLAAGAVLLFPALFILLRVFKREALFGHPRDPNTV